MLSKIGYTVGMSKFFVFLLIVGVGLLFWGGVLEINVHSDRVGDVPGSVLNNVLSRPLYEKGRSLTVTGKRKTELFFAEKDEQKMEVILGFVEKDSDRLQHMMEIGRTASEVKPQAELLVDSLRQARVQSWELSEGELADLSENVKNVMSAAVGVFNAIDTYYSEADQKEELASVTSALDEELGTVIAQEQVSGQVAGTEDDKNQAKSQSNPDETPIPLKF